MDKWTEPKLIGTSNTGRWISSGPYSRAGETLPSSTNYGRSVTSCAPATGADYAKYMGAKALQKVATPSAK
jgi:hypothetical protein